MHDVRYRLLDDNCQDFVRDIVEFMDKHDVRDAREVCAQMQAQMAKQELRMYQRELEMQTQHSERMMDQQKKQTQMLLDQMQQNQAYEKEQAAKIKNYQAENLKLVEELEAGKQTMEEELEKAHVKFMDGAADPEQYDDLQRNIFR